MDAAEARLADPAEGEPGTMAKVMIELTEVMPDRMRRANSTPGAGNR